jgi:hypothetical protein
LAQPLAENVDWARAMSEGFICACTSVVDIKTINPVVILSMIFIFHSLWIQRLRWLPSSRLAHQGSCKQINFCLNSSRFSKTSQRRDTAWRTELPQYQKSGKNEIGNDSKEWVAADNMRANAVNGNTAGKQSPAA